MKKFVLILFTILCTSHLVAQVKPEFGIKTGANISILSASVNNEPSSRVGFNIGIYMRKLLSEKLFFRPELYYSQQGQRNDYQLLSNGPSIGKTTSAMNYINMPLLIEYGRKVTVHFGPQAGVLLTAREKGKFDGESIDVNMKSYHQTLDFSLALGFGVAASDCINFGARFNLGLSNANTEDYVLGGFTLSEVRNQVLHFYAGYSF
jgi:hypothetical protein